MIQSNVTSKKTDYIVTVAVLGRLVPLWFHCRVNW